MDFSSLKEWLELASSLASAFGIPVAIWLFVRDRRRECRTRTLEAYLETNNQYNAFLDRVFDHPELDCGQFRAADKEAAASGMSVQKLTLFTQLIMTLERSWFVYEIHDVAARDPKDDLFGVWRTWEEVFDFWAKRDDFQQAWAIIGPYSPSAFSIDMNKRIANYQRKRSTNVPHLAANGNVLAK